jgi:hypothetical protein
MHHRYAEAIDDENDDKDDYLKTVFKLIEDTDACTEEREVELQRRRVSNGQSAKVKFQLRISYRNVRLMPPRNDPRFSYSAPISAGIVCVEEARRDESFEPIRWVLLHDEAVTGFEQAWRIVDWYACRWQIEQWHRCLKEGCRLEHRRFDQAEDIARLAMILGAVAVRLLWLRDLAQDEASSEDPEALAESVQSAVRRVVAVLAGVSLDSLTPRLCWLTIAMQGGYQPRRGKPPGWIVVWRGWSKIWTMAQGLALIAQEKPPDRLSP